MGEDFTIGIIMGVLVVGAFWIFIGIGAQNDVWERDSVKNGKAEYVLNPVNGSTTWRWKP